MHLKDAIARASDLLSDEPALATMQASRAAATAAAKALERFIKDAQKAMVSKDPDYIRLVSLLDKMKKSPDGLKRVKEACKMAGMSRVPNQIEKIADQAVKDDRATAIIKQLKKDPKTVLREELISIAARSPTDIRAALKKILTDKKVDQYAKAAGFEVVRETVRSGAKKGSKRYNQAATIDNAVEFLGPYIDSMADMH